MAVVGQVGEGKSSLLSAMLGDISKLQGNVDINVGITNNILINLIIKFRLTNIKVI